MDMSDENKLYEFGDVIHRMKTTKMCKKLPEWFICQRVVASYLRLVMQAVLDGFVVTLPFNFGRIYIQKKEVNLKTKYFEKFKQIGKPIELNMKRIGFKYVFVLDAPVVKKFGYNVRVDGKIRKRLSDILHDTNTDYRTNLI